MRPFQLFFPALFILLFSCKKENEAVDATADYTHGIFISNEGNYGTNNSSISYINSNGEIFQDLYLTQNQTELGDVLQSLCLIESNCYAILNNSQKIEIIQLSNMKNSGTITGFDYPRYMLDGSNGYGYVSDGAMDGFIRVVDLATNSIVQSIAVGNGPENMAISGNKLFVCNSGGWSLDNTVSVIDLTTNSLIQTILVGDRPMDCAIDANGDCWVLCSGEIVYDENWNISGHTSAKMAKINGTTLAVDDAQEIGISGDHPRLLDVSPDGTVVYYENAGIYSLSISSTAYNGIEIVADPKNSLNVHPLSGDIWCASLSDFVNPSDVNQYDSTGALIKTFQGAIGSNGCVFN